MKKFITKKTYERLETAMNELNEERLIKQGYEKARQEARENRRWWLRCFVLPLVVSLLGTIGTSFILGFLLR